MSLLDGPRPIKTKRGDLGKKAMSFSLNENAFKVTQVKEGFLCDPKYRQVINFQRKESDSHACLFKYASIFRTHRPVVQSYHVDA